MISYCTTIWTHHQSALCRELHRLLGDEFKMIITLPLDQPLSRERMRMGWNLIPPNEDWIVGPPHTVEEARQIDYDYFIGSADLSVIGYIPFVDDAVVHRRVASGMPTIFQQERIFKAPRRWRDYLSPRKLHQWFAYWKWHHQSNVFFLTMNHWCKDDLVFLHVGRGRTYRWGYLTEVSKEFGAKALHNKVRVGWCGRMIGWKQAHVIIEAVSMLDPKFKSQVEVLLMGDGCGRDNLVALTRRLELDDIVSFMPFASHASAMDFLRDLDIFVFPSNREEGWGATLVEAMDCGCAVVANEAAGATLELINDGINGFTFRDRDVKGVTTRIAQLIESPELRCMLGRSAWATVQKWSPQVGAVRLRDLFYGLLGRSKLENLSGLCELIY